MAISKHEIIEPFWFENADEDAVTVINERYIHVLNKFWRALGTRCGVNQDVQWFQQNGAIPHIANITMEGFDHRFSNRLISRRHEPEWSLYSPNLNLQDFYHAGSRWLTCMRTIYNPLLNSKWPSIRRFVPYRKKCVRVIVNFARQIQVCHQQHNGSHLEHVL